MRAEFVRTLPEDNSICSGRSMSPADLFVVCALEKNLGIVWASNEVVAGKHAQTMPMLSSTAESIA